MSNQDAAGPGLLRRWREDNGLTQGALAIRLGVSQVTVSDWEARRKAPRIDSALRIDRETNGMVPVSAWATEASAEPTPPSAA